MSTISVKYPIIGAKVIRGTDVEKRVEVFPGIYVEDIVVSLDVHKPYRVVGDLFKVLSGSSKGKLSYSNTFSLESDTWKLATQEEIEFFNNGGKNINDMQPISFETAKHLNEHSLITEAKRRYPVGTKFYPAHVSINPKNYCIITEDSEFEIRDNIMYAIADGGDYLHNCSPQAQS